ncbi:MAG: hypothetical protein LQ341_003433, partial [Variospora aurantia]
GAQQAAAGYGAASDPVAFCDGKPVFKDFPTGTDAAIHQYPLPPAQSAWGPLARYQTDEPHVSRSLYQQPGVAASHSFLQVPYPTSMTAPDALRLGTYRPSAIEPAPQEQQRRVDPFMPSGRTGYGLNSVSMSSYSSGDTSASRRSSSGVGSGPVSYAPSRLPLQQAEDRTVRYILKIRQQPIAARACGMGNQDRRVVDPPPIVQLSLSDYDPRSPGDVNALRNPYIAMHCTLLDSSGKDVTQAQDSRDPQRVTRGLTGDIMASPFVGIDPAAPVSNTENARLGCFFIFSDMSCRHCGRFRLQFKLVNHAVEGLPTGSRNSILGLVESDPFEVFPAKDFPGMKPSTALMKDLKRQGASVKIKEGRDGKGKSKGKNQLQTQESDLAGEGACETNLPARHSLLICCTPNPTHISINLAVSRSFKFLLCAFLLFISLVLILAPSARLASLLSAFYSKVLPLAKKPVPGQANQPTTTVIRPLATTSMAPKAFKKPPQAPPMFTGTPKSLIEDTNALIKESRGVQDKIVVNVKQSDATFKDVMLPMAQDENRMGLKIPIIGFYQAVSTDQALRNASTEAEKLIEDFSIESSMREDIFKLVDAALNKAEKLDPESKRLLEKEHKNFIRNGLGLPAGEKRDRFKAIKKKLSDISIMFSKNLNEENGGVWFTPAELEGTPEDVISGFEKGEGENAGKLKMSFKYPDLFPTLKYCKNIETRKQVFIANENKCNENAPLFREAINLRDEAARLLGYPNHAAFKIEDKMAKTTETVDDFLGDLRKRLTKGGAAEKKTLLELKQKDLEARGEEKTFDGHYFLWDNRFYDRLMLEKDYSVDQEKLAEYFPLQTSIRGMLQIFEQLFGLVFVEIEGSDRASVSPSGKGDDITWHPDVKLYSVWDDQEEGSGFVGYLYLDLHPREGKYGHAANFNIQPGFTDENGKRRYPATALVCNFSKPTPKKPSLLKHDEVVTLFHELGHGIHDLVSRTIYSRFHGTNTVRDFVEAPSQMLENWCWTPSQLKALSHHYSSLSPDYEAAWQEKASGQSKPDAKLPDELIENLIKTKHVNDALFNLRQLHFGIFDMTVHEPKSHEELEGYDIPDLYNRLRKEISGLDGPEDLGEGYKWGSGNGHATFGHLMGGYDAGYYGYLSSQVYSADMFHTVFAKDPMNGKEGRRYRHTVLQRGGSQDEMQTLEDFLGRKPNSGAFYRELGLE